MYLLHVLEIYCPRSSDVGGISDRVVFALRRGLVGGGEGWGVKALEVIKDIFGHVTNTLVNIKHFFVTVYRMSNGKVEEVNECHSNINWNFCLSVLFEQRAD